MEPNDYVRENFIEPAQEFYTFCNEIYTDVKTKCLWLDSHFDDFAKKNLPPEAHHLAMSIFRTLPETVVCGACMSGVSAVPAVLYLTARVVIITLPHVKQLIENLVDAKALGEAIGKSAKELFATYKNFRPAIAMCAAIATVASFVFGWGTGNVSLIMRSPLYAIVTYLAVADILRDAQAVAPIVGEGPGMPPGNGSGEAYQQEGVPHHSANAAASVSSEPLAQNESALSSTSASSLKSDSLPSELTKAAPSSVN